MAFTSQYLRRIRAELAAEGVAVVCRDLGLGNQLSHLFSNASGHVPDIAVSLADKGTHLLNDVN